MENTELAYLSGTEQLRLFSNRSISPVEVLQAQIERAEQLEPKINAFSETLYDSALPKSDTEKDARVASKASRLVLKKQWPSVEQPPLTVH